MTLTDITLICLTSTVALSLSAQFLLARRLHRRITAMERRPATLGQTELDSIAQKLGHRVADSGNQSLQSLHLRLDEIHENFDWLVSDRMIEQAIAIARHRPATGDRESLCADDLAAIYKRHRQ